MRKNTTLPARITFAITISTIVYMTLMLWISIGHKKSANSKSELSPLSEFSAARAYKHIQALTKHQNIIKTEGDKLTRDYIISALANYKVRVESQYGLGVTPELSSAGFAHNIVAHLPGRKPGKALALVVHYDSSTFNQNSSGTIFTLAVALETLRALSNQIKRKNNIIFIFTDGKESGLIGANLFTERHPWMANTRFVVNIEHLDNWGPFRLLSTSQNNEHIISGLSHTLIPILASSFLQGIESYTPQKTNFNAFNAIGVPGLNFAITSWHGQQNANGNFYPLQEQGDALLATAEYFSDTDLYKSNSHSQVYFNLPVLGIVAYSENWSVLLASLSCFLFGFTLKYMSKQNSIRTSKVGICALIIAATCIALPALAQLTWSAFTDPKEAKSLIILNSNHHYYWYILCLTALTVSCYGFLTNHLKEYIKHEELTLGAALLGLLIALPVSVIHPGASYIFLWPIFFILLSLALVTAKNKTESHSQTALMLLGATPCIILFCSLLYLLLFTLSNSAVYIYSLLLVLFLFLLTSSVNQINKFHLFTLLPFGLGIFFIYIAKTHTTLNPDQPKTSSLFYVQAGSVNQAYWASENDTLDNWQQQFFKNTLEKRNLGEVIGHASSKPLLLSPAPALFDEPVIEVLSDITDCDHRHIALVIKSRRKAPKLTLIAEDIIVERSSVEKNHYTDDAMNNWILHAYAVPEEGLQVSITIPSHQEFKLRLIDTVYGLPKHNFEPRPENTIAKPHSLSDSSLVIKEMIFLELPKNHHTAKDIRAI